MNLISLAISILWLLIGVLVILGVLWLVFYALAKFGLVVPEPIKQGVYVVVLILIVIAGLTLIAGGGGTRSFRLSGATTLPPWPAIHHAVTA